MKIFYRNFSLKTEDFEWFQQIKAEASKYEVGSVSYSRILADLINYARISNYRFGAWSKPE